MPQPDPPPKRWPLVTPITSRDDSGNYDARLINCYAELNPVTKEYEIEKRPGLLFNQDFNAGAPQNNFNWNGSLWEVYGDTLFKNGLSFGTLLGAGGAVSFCIVGSTPQKLMLKTNSNGFYTDGTTLTTITDTNYPALTVPGISYLDGTLYVMDPYGTIWGSLNLDDPSAWDALNKVVAQIEPDAGIGLAKQLVYVIAFKASSTEAFYDAGNATGSPLESIPGAFQPYGCFNAATIQEIDGTLLWMSTNKSVSPQIAMMTQLQLSIISTPPVERILESAASNTAALYYSWVLKIAGHRFYGLTLVSENVTLVYDLDQQIWSYWQDHLGNALPIVSISYDNQNRIICQYNTTGITGTGNSVFIGPDYKYPTDAAFSTVSFTINVDIYTPRTDFGIDRKKMLTVMRVNADQTLGSQLFCRYSDDDYQNWSNFRSFNLGVKRPFITEEGTFYSRAYHFRHYAPTPLRIKSVDLQMGVGTL